MSMGSPAMSALDEAVMLEPPLEPSSIHVEQGAEEPISLGDAMVTESTLPVTGKRPRAESDAMVLAMLAKLSCWQ